MKTWSVDIAVRECPVETLDAAATAVLCAFDPSVVGFDDESIISLTVAAPDRPIALVIAAQRVAKLLEHLAPNASVTVPAHEIADH